MNFMLVLFVIMVSFNVSHLRKHRRKCTAKLQEGERPNFLGPKELEELRAKQNPWENSGRFEGDIVRSRARTAIANVSYRWLSREIPYEVCNRFTPNDRNTIVRALHIIGNKTCVKPRPRIYSDTESVLFSAEQGKSCYSLIGSKHVLQQKIYLDPFVGCVSESTIQHEFLHALGLFHEQAAPDRDKYIQINWENIREDMRYNFDIAPWATVRFGLPYDLDSIMHYSGYAFSKNGKPTIEAKEPGRMVTKNRHLSEIDIIKISKMYNCD